uniref:GIT Spa2 homology (SHD) domain-containing protein n=1 Tax=Kalmanozyma brasiliensis (strain GHG001) TaxID=1365824 RepID=V5EZQ6_KALBG
MPMQPPPQPPHQYYNSNTRPAAPPMMNDRQGSAATGFYLPNGNGNSSHDSYASSHPSTSPLPALSSPLGAPSIRLPDAPSTGARSLSGNQDASFASSSGSSQPSASGSRYRRVRPDTEEIRRVGRSHYVELLGFLKSHLTKVEQTLPRSNAREKLTRLSKQQFTELSTDVYDELMRRQNSLRNGNSQPFLAVRDEFHPKRNQARQKLATLPKNRFKDLASDVFFELERRFPELKQEYRPEVIAREREMEQQMRDQAEALLQRKDSRSQAQPSTSDRIVPAKSTMVEEDLAVPYSANGSSKLGDRSIENESPLGRVTSPIRDSIGSNGSNGVPDNRSTRYSQASSLGTGFFNGYTGSIAAGSVASPNLGRGSVFEASDAATEKMRSDYELRIAKLQQQVSSLESQMAEAAPRARKADELAGRYEELDRQLSLLRKELDDSKQKHESDRELHRTSTAQRESELESIRRELAEKADAGGQAELEALQQNHSQQAEVVNELKQEVSTLLEELRDLSTRNEEMQADRDNDLVVIKDLERQMANYKRLYEAAKIELRNLKATSQLYVQPPKADDLMPASEKGAIADVNLTAFQSSIDELLAAARYRTPGSILLSMKTVVLATTLVTDDVSKYEQIPANVAELSNEELDQLMALKSKCSATLNNLMSACRNHASSHGLSPVSLLDAAASHVSATIVEMVKLLKVRKASRGEPEDLSTSFSEDSAPTRLRPLHINTQSANREVSATLSPNLANQSSFANLSLGEDRLSPHIRSAPTMGRYSPIGYKAETLRKDSSGDNTWRSRTTSVSSVGSANASTPNMGSKPQLSNLFGTKRFAGEPFPTSADASLSSNGASRQPSGPASPSPQSSDDQVVRSETYDSLATVTSASGSGFDEPSGEESWVELRNYIDVQTEAIVHSIQALLSAIREGAQGNQLSEHLTQITTIVSSIVAISKDNLPARSKLEGERILDELTDNCDELSEMQSHQMFDKTTKSNMASASYGVAKGLKALNALFNDVDLSN